MIEEEIKNLPPKEKIRKLKELEEKKKEEIEEAQKILKESEKELTEREDWEKKIPIPQVEVESTENRTEAEKEIIEAHKGIAKKRGLGAEEFSKEEIIPKKGESLEETVGKEKVEISAGIRESEYTVFLSQQPINNLQQEIKNLYNTVKDKGYISPEEERKAEYLTGAVEQKIEDMYTGKYPSFSEELAEKALASRKLGASLLYKRVERW